MQHSTTGHGQWPWSVSDPDHFLLRLLQDMAEQINADQWDRRAAWFDTCNPFLALQCRRHAWLLRNVLTDAEIPAALRG